MQPYRKHALRWLLGKRTPCKWWHHGLWSKPWKLDNHNLSFNKTIIIYNAAGSKVPPHTSILQLHSVLLVFTSPLSYIMSSPYHLWWLWWGEGGCYVWGCLCKRDSKWTHFHIYKYGRIRFSKVYLTLLWIEPGMVCQYRSQCLIRLYNKRNIPRQFLYP